MQYHEFDGIQLSQLGMGAMRLPQTEPGFAKPIDEPKAMELIDCCISHGVNYFDTAYIYHMGQSEVLLGKALKRYPRDSFCVADKFNVQAEPDYEKQFARQLERLQMDRIDFYLLHGVTDKLISDYLDHGAPEYFREQKQLGKIRYFGFSFHGSPDALRQMLARGPWDFVQIQLNYYDWFHGTAREQYEILREHHIPIMVMEPAHGGMLADLPEAGRDLLLTAKPGAAAASWAFRFLRTLPGIAVVLSGMSELGRSRTIFRPSQTTSFCLRRRSPWCGRSATCSTDSMRCPVRAAATAAPTVPSSWTFPSCLPPSTSTRLGEKRTCPPGVWPGWAPCRRTSGPPPASAAARVPPTVPRGWTCPPI